MASSPASAPETTISTVMIADRGRGTACWTVAGPERLIMEACSGTDG